MTEQLDIEQKLKMLEITVTYLEKAVEFERRLVGYQHQMIEKLQQEKYEVWKRIRKVQDEIWEEGAVNHLSSMDVLNMIGQILFGDEYEE